jgi:hypothetical protein
LLAVEAFSSLLEAPVLVEDWRIEYNTLRPIALSTIQSNRSEYQSVLSAPSAQPGASGTCHHLRVADWRVADEGASLLGQHLIVGR